VAPVAAGDHGAIMETTAGVFWDEKYAVDGYFYGTKPNAWLTSRVDGLRPAGHALSIADGEGRNSVWLAEQGLHVTAVDASGRAIAKARALAAARRVTVEHVHADLLVWDWPVGCFDLAVAIFAHFPSTVRPLVHRRVIESLVPGGLVLLEAYSPYQRLHDTGGPKDLDMLYTAWRLKEDFAGCELLELVEAETELDEGSGHRGRSAVVRLVARRQRR
jgi:SAM-dependent methyltransferase